MSRPAKRRHAEAAPAQTQLISNFTRVSKSHAFGTSAKKLKDETSVPAAVPIPIITPASKKRKVSISLLDEDDDTSSLNRRNASFAPSSDEDDESTPSSRRMKRACRREEVPTPNNDKTTATRQGRVATKVKKLARAAPTRAQIPHKPREATVISQAQQHGRKIQSKIDATYKKTKPKTPAAEKRAASVAVAADEVPQQELPAHLVELVSLHRAFLRTAMLQFAHNGSNVPLDLQSFLPHAAQAWGKRQVTVDDVRRCVAMESSAIHGSASPFMVSDYGRGKVCLEFHPGHTAATVNEDGLCRQFEDNLQALCAHRVADNMSDADIPLGALSLSELPQAAIADMHGGVSANPQLTKGHRALASLKSGLAAKQHEKQAKQDAAARNPLLNPDGTKMSLLDRLRAKEQARADGPAPASGPELQRRAALNRVSDVAATISMLSLSNPVSLPRQAFAMQAILEKLKDSMRMPISRDEGASCVRLIAAEVAPEWLRIVTIGGRENVVIQRHGQPVDKVIEERVRKLLG